MNLFRGEMKGGLYWRGISRRALTGTSRVALCRAAVVAVMVVFVPMRRTVSRSMYQVQRLVSGYLSSYS